MYKAANALSGFKRFLPRSKRALDTAGLFYKNWARTAIRVRATPLKAEWARAFASFSHVKAMPLMGLLIVLGFLGLFRVRELLSLSFAQLTFVSDTVLYVVFVDSKGAKLKGSPETVKIQDRQVIRVLRHRAGLANAYDLVFPFTYKQVSDFLREAAQHFGLPVEQATSHCLRRGGATWHFSVFASYDLAAEHGRWRHVRDCRTYINSAMADLTAVGLSEDDCNRIAVASKAWPAVLVRLAK